MSGYPGTPSTEVLETIAKQREELYIEWSVNEKVAMEVAAGAAYTGARALVTMKQVGLNVASDPLMSLAYIGVKGGMVVLVADDPGPVSSQTEQDTRHFAQFAHLPVFDPSTPEEAYHLIGEAFDYSEKYQTPVIFRPTTQVCHSCARVEIDGRVERRRPEGFIKDPKWVIFPKLSYHNHLKIIQNEKKLADDFSGFSFNVLQGGGNKGIICGGVSAAYAREALRELDLRDVRLFKVTTPHPFPEKLSLAFLDGLTEVLAIEELDPVLEDALLKVVGKYHLPVMICGKAAGSGNPAGAHSFDSVKDMIAGFMGIQAERIPISELPPLPARPPVLCAGCPHRASFYSVKTALEKLGQKAVFTGDIGCYTLGNAKPLDMVDTCLCMGAGITIAQGITRCDASSKQIAFIGDSTFFHTGIAGVINAVYNETDITVVVLDNSTTAMTGHQPHPGTGKTMMGNITEKISIEKVLRGCSVQFVKKANPLDQAAAVQAVREAVNFKGVSVVIFEAPCIALVNPRAKQEVKESCIGCKRCIQEIGCPAMKMEGGRAKVDRDLCYGCALCRQVCPVKAIDAEEGAGV